MQNITQTQAIVKVREAMNGLIKARKTATPKECKDIDLCMTELRKIAADLAEEAKEPSPPPAEEELAADEELDDPEGDLEGEDLDILGEDDPMLEGEDVEDFVDEDGNGLDDLDEASAEDDDLMGEDEELALSALELAASALKAASEEEEADGEEEKEAEEASEESEEDEEDLAADVDGSEDVEDVEDTEEVAAEEEVPAEEASEESEEDVAAEEDASDDDMGVDDGDDMEDVDDGEVEAEDDTDSEEILSEDELKALEDEGLVEGKSNLAARLAAVRARIETLVAADVGEAGDVLAVDPAVPGSQEAVGPAPDAVGDVEMAPSYEEDAEEVLTTAEYHALMSSLSAEDRAELRRSEVVGADISAKKIPRQAFKKMERTALKNRKRRKFRSVVKKSAKGKKSSVALPGGKRKIVKKHFFFSTYDAKGKFMGTFWIAQQKVNKETAQSYQQKHGVKHPGMLPKVDPEKKWGAARKKAAAAKKK